MTRIFPAQMRCLSAGAAVVVEVITGDGAIGNRRR
jgi:hypothetical protein